MLRKLVSNGPVAILLMCAPGAPDHSGVFMGQRDGSPVLASSGDEGSQPLTPVITLRIDPAERGARAMNEECTQIAIPACTEPEEPWRAARQVFPWDQYQTGRQLAAVLELGHVTNRGDSAWWHSV